MTPVRLFLTAVVATAAAIVPAAALAQSFPPATTLRGVPSATAPSTATAPLQLTLADAVARGLQHNLAVILEEQRLTATRSTKLSALAEVLPHVDLVIANEEDAADVLDIHAAGTDVTQGRIDAAAYEQVARQITSRFPNVFTWETLPSAKRDPWFPVSTAIREGLNYWRYLTPAFANASTSAGVKGRAAEGISAPPGAEANIVWNSASAGSGSAR